jgi:hypothetical protein
MDDMMMDYEYEFRTTDETMVIIEGLLWNWTTGHF